VRRLLALLVGALVASALVLVSPALAQAESLEISPGAEPTQDVPLSIKVSGVADGTHALWVFVDTSGGCGATPEYDFGSSLASGTVLSAGSFEKTYSYTPTGVQKLHTLRVLGRKRIRKPGCYSRKQFYSGYACRLCCH
jgi:hypothetical protein